MTTFETESRTCGRCGNEWEAPAFWSDDLPCYDCSVVAKQQMIDGVNADRPYHIESIGGACPTQAEGTWVDGQRFYFRARHGEWLLRVDPDDAVGGRVIAGGDDDTHGVMEPAAVVALLDEAAGYDPRQPAEVGRTAPNSPPMDPEPTPTPIGRLSDQDEPEDGVFGDPEIHAALTRAALDPADTTNERGECDHPGIDHGQWSYTAICPKCRRCKFVGHGPLCDDCYEATR